MRITAALRAVAGEAVAGLARICQEVVWRFGEEIAYEIRLTGTNQAPIGSPTWGHSLGPVPRTPAACRPRTSGPCNTPDLSAVT